MMIWLIENSYLLFQHMAFLFVVAGLRNAAYLVCTLVPLPHKLDVVVLILGMPYFPINTSEYFFASSMCTILEQLIPKSLGIIPSFVPSGAHICTVILQFVFAQYKTCAHLIVCFRFPFIFIEPKVLIPNRFFH